MSTRAQLGVIRARRSTAQPAGDASGTASGTRPATQDVEGPVGHGPDDGQVVARGGVEPPTFRFSVGRSYQLSYLAGCTPPRGGRSAWTQYRRPRRAPKPAHGALS